MCKLESVGQSWGLGRDKQMEKRVTNSSGLLGPEGLWDIRLSVLKLGQSQVKQDELAT